MQNNIITPNEYFIRSTKKVYIEREYILESFKEYLEHRYGDNCYSYSFCALMGLNSNDYLVRGNIDVRGHFDYHHGWVEFKYKDNWYVFDSLIYGVTPKDKWYETYKPKIDYKKSQKEILDTFLNEKNAFKINECFWQFKYYVNNEGKDHYSPDEFEKFVRPFNKANGFIPALLMYARLQLNPYTEEIMRFIAYDEPIC